MPPALVPPPVPDLQAAIQTSLKAWIGGLVLDLLVAQATIAQLQAEIAALRRERAS